MEQLPGRVLVARIPHSKIALGPNPRFCFSQTARILPEKIHHAAATFRIPENPRSSKHPQIRQIDGSGATCFRNRGLSVVSSIFIGLPILKQPPAEASTSDFRGFRLRAPTPTPKTRRSLSVQKHPPTPPRPPDHTLTEMRDAIRLLFPKSGFSCREDRVSFVS